MGVASALGPTPFENGLSTGVLATCCTGAEEGVSARGPPRGVNETASPLRATGTPAVVCSGWRLLAGLSGDSATAGAARSGKDAGPGTEADAALSTGSCWTAEAGACKFWTESGLKEFARGIIFCLGLLVVHTYTDRLHELKIPVGLVPFP